jgi:hypothetical protein
MNKVVGFGFLSFVESIVTDARCHGDIIIKKNRS